MASLRRSEIRIYLQHSRSQMLCIYHLHNFSDRKYYNFYFFLTPILFNLRKIELNCDSKNVRFMLHFGFDNNV